MAKRKAAAKPTEPVAPKTPKHTTEARKQTKPRENTKTPENSGNAQSGEVRAVADEFPEVTAERLGRAYEIGARLQQTTGRWREISAVRDRMMVESKRRGMTRDQARIWTFEELDRLYPPEPEPEPDPEPTKSPQVQAENRLKGLGTIPDDWPTLPDNASLAAELGWVQAQRLRVVEEQPSGSVVVHLDRAGAPAPSHAALGWLETSIRSYAKFVDVAAKALGAASDDTDLGRRERMRIEEIRQLLDEMHQDETGAD